MKKAGVFTTLVLVTFALSYLACCYLIPALRIKLDANPWTYLLASIRHMAFLKIVISLVAGLIVGGLSAILNKSK